jgi:hypothetical protein
VITNPAIIQELRRIADENDGLLEPVHVVEAARNAASPLHPHFEWDDSIAAQNYRIWQARDLLIKVKVILDGPNETQVPTRVFVSLTPDRHSGDGYRPLDVVLANTSLRNQLLEDALHEMERFQAKYATLRELTKVVGEMRKAIAQIKRKMKPARARSGGAD